MGIATKLHTFALTIIATGATSASAQTVLYVDDDAPAGGDGSSWETAFNDLQDALDVKVPQLEPVEIRLGQGTYVPSLRIDALDPRSATFLMRSLVAIRGGFAGVMEDDPDSRDINLFITRLSGDLAGDDQPKGTNTSENAYHVLRAELVGHTAVLDGCYVTAGHANVGIDWPDTNHVGAGILILSAGPVMKDCTFHDNVAEYGGAVYGRLVADVQFVGCRFLNNTALVEAGAVRAREGSGVAFQQCEFDSNSAGSVGGGISCADQMTLDVSNCVFRNNQAEVGGGISHDAASASIENCDFIDNLATVGGGGIQIVGSNQNALHKCRFFNNFGGTVAGAAVLSGGGWTVDRCEFIGNVSDFLAGAVVISSPGVFSNTIFSRNASQNGGGVVCSPESNGIALANCTLTDNDGGAAEFQSNSQVKNSIIWGNTPAQIIGSAVMNYSNIQGGWTGIGSNNISADPLFIQAGCDNLRLGIGSPCINAGSNSLIPLGITSDLDGNPRIIDAIVDMGAYEGEHEMLPPAACLNGIQEAQFAVLVPNGGNLAPLINPAAFLENYSSVENGYMVVTQFEHLLHPGARGFNQMSTSLAVETSLPSGGYFLRVYHPFDQADLNGFDPFALDLTYFDTVGKEWVLAAAANTQNSPGHDGPLGDRLLVTSGPPSQAVSWDLGDYGVYWDAVQGKGFAWANVDHASDFAFGVPLPACAGDTTYPSDNIISAEDLIVVLDNWGDAPTGPANFADVNQDGIVDVDDLLAVINGWGKCE